MVNCKWQNMEYKIVTSKERISKKKTGDASLCQILFGLVSTTKPALLIEA